jgi:HD-GYP domain-containing protein (c-di-GMP phosphodiesterase class II)
MRLASTSSVAPGTELARDVTVSPRPGHLVCAGVVLDDGLLESLRVNGVTRVWVRDELAEGIGPTTLLGERLRGDAIAEVTRLHAAVRKALVTRRRRLDERVVDGLGRLAERIVDDAVAVAGRPHDLLDLAAAHRYALNHPVDACTLAVLLAIRHMTTAGWRQGVGAPRYDAPRTELARLAHGMLLCDVGMLTLPRHVLENPGELDEAAWEHVRRHPMAGVELLGGTTSFVLKSVVRSHHERWDGHGYPDGAAGESIQRFARYAAVADAYDAMTSDRPHRAALAPADAWSEIIAGAGTAFDPAVVDAFRAVVPRHPLGTEVVLSDGRVGVVCDVDLDDPLRPTVRVREGDAIVELRAEPAAA